MSISKKHSEMYKEMRMRCMTRKLFYIDCLHDYKNKNNWVEGLLAFTSGGTAAGLVAWQFIPEVYFVVTSTILALLSSALAIVKVIKKYSDEVARYKELVQIYAVMDDEYDELVFATISSKDTNSDDFSDKATRIWRSKEKVKDKEDPNVKEKTAQKSYQEKAEQLLSGKLELGYQTPNERITQKESL